MRRHHPEIHIKAVHHRGFVEYLKRMCTTLEPGKSVYPYVFPIRNVARPPKDMAVRAGFYCIDTFTSLNRNAYQAAKGAVDCALTGTWSLTAADFEANGHRIGTLHLPTLVVQEGGYRSRSLGANARFFFTGLWSGMLVG